MAPKIFIAFTGSQDHPLGSTWEVTARSTGFYLESFDRQGSAVHASLHGPTDDKPSHRFHLKVDRKAARQQLNKGKVFLTYDVPREGYAIRGQTIGPSAYLVARIRWTWELDRDKFRDYAYCGQVPQVQSHRRGAVLRGVLEPNMAWDIDVVISYDKPYWPNARRTERDNSRLGPLEDGKSLYLTATSYLRPQWNYPVPPELKPPLPGPDETPNRITCGGPDESGVYWFVETITSKEILARTPQGMQ